MSPQSENKSDDRFLSLGSGVLGLGRGCLPDGTPQRERPYHHGVERRKCMRPVGVVRVTDLFVPTVFTVPT